jgi:hypothetical protein
MTILVLLMLAAGIHLIYFMVTGMIENPDDGSGVFGLVCGILIIIAAYYIGEHMFFSLAALPIGAWEADLKVKALIKEGKLYDYTLRQATIDAQEMANEYWARAYVVADADGDFDVMMSIPEDMTLIREVKPRE